MLQSTEMKQEYEMRNLNELELAVVSGANDVVPITSAVSSTTGAGLGALIGTFIAGPIGGAIGSGIGAGAGTALGIHAQEIADWFSSQVSVRPVYSGLHMDMIVIPEKSGHGEMSMSDAKKIWPDLA
jgi:outer membrane lipoprotein SlyB